VIDPQAGVRSYLKLTALVVLLGVLSAVVTFVFIFLVHEGVLLIWQQARAALGVDPRLFILAVCALGGLVVGLLVRYFGDHTAIFAEMMVEFGRTGRFDYRAAPGIVITAFVSLVAGGSLGPEAALADATGGLGTWLSDKLHFDKQETRTMGFSGVSAMLAAFITSPFSGALLGLESAQAESGGARKTYFWVLFPSLLASAVAVVVYVWLAGQFFETLYKFPSYSPRLIDLVYAVPLGLVGGATGLLFMLLLRWFQRAMRPLAGQVVLRGLLGGAVLGALGVISPLILFSGEAGTSQLIEQAAQFGVVTLFLLAMGKLLATSVLLTTGWKGGYIFPLMFSSVALGLVASHLFPMIPVAVAVAATIAGCLVAALRAPLFAALFAIVLVQVETSPVVAVAVVVAGMFSALVAMLTRRGQPAEQASGEA
jgi:H+/Cl- antiporter ClcA